MKVNMIPAMLDLCHNAQDALLIEGVHGIGKTQVIEDWCHRNGYHLTVLHLANQEVGDLIGNPVTETLPDGNKITVWTRPSWLQRMYDESSKGRHCVLLLDELNRAQQDVLQPALQLVQKGEMHQHKLPIFDGVRTLIVGAVNPETGTGNYQVNTLDPALLDRFLTVKVEPDASSWLEWARGAKVAKVVRDYITAYPDRLWTQPKDTTKKGPTPRAWEMLAKSIVAMGENPDGVVLYAACEGRVGPEFAGQFVTFFNSHSNVIGAGEVLGHVKKNKKLPIVKLGETVGELVDGLEAITKHEIAANLADMWETIEEKKKPEIVLTILAFLYGIEQEIKVSLIKKFREEKKDIFTEIVKLDETMNNKELFRKIATIGHGAMAAA